MIKFEKIHAGMILYDVRKATGWSRHKWDTWPVRVVEVDTEKRRVLASWNHNKAEWMNERRITRYRAKRPEEPSQNSST